MEASEFKKRVDDLCREFLSDRDGPSANSGVGFFISDIESLIDEWNSEDHKFSL